MIRFERVDLFLKSLQRIGQVHIVDGALFVVKRLQADDAGVIDLIEIGGLKIQRIALKGQDFFEFF